MAEKPWLRAYPRGIDWHAELEAKPLHALLDEAAAEVPDHPYIDFLGKIYSYRETAELVNRMAAGLQKLGLQKGDRVGLFMPNCPHYLISLFAISKAGGTAVSISPLYSEMELLEQIEDAEIDSIITLALSATYPKIQKVLGESCARRLIVGSLTEALPFPKNLLFRIFKRKQLAKVAWDDCHVAFRALLENDGRVETPSIDPVEDVAVLQYTGGTTGTPKGAMLTHANLTVNAQQALLAFRDLVPGREVMLMVLPLFHIFALTAVGLTGTLSRATIVMHPRFHLDDVLADLEKKGITLLFGVPTMFTAINHALEQTPRRFPALRLSVSGGAPLPAEVLKRFERLTGTTIREGYGLTESSPVVSLTPPADLRKLGSIGMPAPGTTLTIVDRDDFTTTMPLGEPGEIMVDGPQVMKGYWRRPAESADVLKDGHLLTGDIGYMDEDGYTFIIDRKKETIKVSGYNVFPRVIEEAIYEHPGVAEAAVVGLPDEYRGQTPKAYVVLKDVSEPLTDENLLAFLEDRIGKHEMPTAVEFRASLPKTPIGKISKKDLLAEEAERESAG